MSGLKIGYARVSTDGQDLTAQRNALVALGVEADRIYVDHGSRVPTAPGRDCERRWRRVGRATCSS
jgi:predicted site-specific integrase-resolvase